MTKPTLPPRFKLKLPPRAVTPNPRGGGSGVHRGSPRLRGYDSAWDRLSVRFRRQNPWCRFCMQEKPEEDWQPTAVADHVLPAADFPELRLTWSNLIPLCQHHHDSTKARMELYARERDCLPLLAVWCKDLESRPRQFWPAGLVL